MYVQLQSTVIYLAYHLVWFNVRSLYNKMSSFNTERIESVCFVLSASCEDKKFNGNVRQYKPLLVSADLHTK
jgi:hypothetical protein